MDILDIQHINQNNFCDAFLSLTANISDFVKTRIFFRHTNLVGNIQFMYGFAKNSEANYSSGFKLQDKFFKNYMTNALQSYQCNANNGSVGASNTFGSLADISHVLGNAQVIYLGLGGDAKHYYMIQHIWNFAYYPRESNIDSNGKYIQDAFFANSEALRYVFKINISEQQNSQVWIDSSENYDLSNLFVNGNTGTINEKFNGFSPTFNLKSLSSVSGINSSSDTPFSGVIVSKVLVSNTDELVIHIANSEIDNLETNKDFLQNRLYDYNRAFLNGSTSSSQFIKNLIATTDGTFINFSFDIVGNIFTNQKLNIWATPIIREACAEPPYPITIPPVTPPPTPENPIVQTISYPCGSGAVTTPNNGKVGIVDVVTTFGAGSGNIEIEFATYSIPDAMQIFFDNNPNVPVYESGWRSANYPSVNINNELSNTSLYDPSFVNQYKQVYGVNEMPILYGGILSGGELLGTSKVILAKPAGVTQMRVRILAPFFSTLWSFQTTCLLP